MRKVVVGARNARPRRSLFTYFNSFIDAEHATRLDVLICDEAHRIRETSRQPVHPGRGDGPPPSGRCEELIAVARVPVFLLDEHQVVHAR